MQAKDVVLPYSLSLLTGTVWFWLYVSVAAAATTTLKKFFLSWGQGERENVHIIPADRCVGSPGTKFTGICGRPI